MTATVLAILLTLSSPAAVQTPPTDAAILPVKAVTTVTTITTRPQPGLDVHIAPIDIAGDFQAKMLELSG
ncbi:MAG TPA: hypothetical protein VKF82_02570 [Candidatus Eremiobacteraceae bacterium]|nr:hypothetical protein [Candidatus Eremiobacteraceae bacterium]